MVLWPRGCLLSRISCGSLGTDRRLRNEGFGPGKFIHTIKSEPRRLKPHSFCTIYGTPEGVPFQKHSRKQDFFRRLKSCPPKYDGNPFSRRLLRSGGEGSRYAGSYLRALISSTSALICSCVSLSLKGGILGVC